jgi:chemotaxis protein histidine kinase CheA
MATPATNTLANTSATSSIISLLMDEVRQSLEPKISHVLADYQMYKETHDALLQIPFVKHLLENQCKCNSATKEPQSTPHDPIQLEIIDATVNGLSNLDSITEYINATVVSEAVSEAASEAVSEAVSEAEEEEEAVSEAEEEEEEAEEEEAEEEEEEAEEEEAEVEAASEAEEEVEEVEDEGEEVKAASEAVSEAEEEEEEEVKAADEEVKAEEEEVKAEEEAEEEEVEAEEEEEELELFEVEIKGKTYVTNDEMEGDIYEYVNDEVGEIVGAFRKGVAKFTKKPKSAQKK